MLIIVLFCLAASSAIHPQQSATEHGAMVMGFDQDKTLHHFRLYADGGAIEVAVKDANDIKDRDAIREHLPHIALMFGAGDFDAPMLVHNSRDVPGTTVLMNRKDRISYHYVETASGGRVDVVTLDPQALDALHAFLRYQIKEHHTGDPLTITKR